MTLDVERDTLIGVLRHVADVVESRTTIPILSNVMLVGGAGELTLTATNLDIEVSATVEAAGSIDTTVDAAKLVAAVTSLKPGRLTIAPAENRPGAITIKSGRSVRTLSVLPPTDFPKRKPLECATSFPMSAPSLARLLDACQVAQSTDETRYYLIGVYLHVVDGQLRAAATDGIRLVRAQTAAPPGCEGMPQIIVPSKAIGLLRKSLSKATGSIALSVTENAIEAQIGSVRIVAKAVDGSYPDYERVIPTEAGAGNRMSVERDALVDAVSGVGSVVDPEGERKRRPIRLELKPGEDLHTISARDSTGSSASDEVAACVEGDATAIELDQRYLLSIAGLFAEGGRVTLHFVGAAPAPVRLTSDKDPDLVAVIQSIGVPGAKA